MRFKASRAKTTTDQRILLPQIQNVRREQPLPGGKSRPGTAGDGDAPHGSSGHSKRRFFTLSEVVFFLDQRHEENGEAMSSIRNFTQMQKRLLLLETIILIACLCVEGRLVYLQVFKHGQFQQLAFRQQYTQKETNASRGMIDDRPGLCWP